MRRGHDDDQILDLATSHRFEVFANRVNMPTPNEGLRLDRRPCCFYKLPKASAFDRITPKFPACVPQSIRALSWSAASIAHSSAVSFEVSSSCGGAPPPSIFASSSLHFLYRFAKKCAEAFQS